MGNAYLVTLLVAATFVETFVFRSVPYLRRTLLWHPHSHCSRNQSFTFKLFDRKLPEVIYDNETVQTRSRRNQVVQIQYPQSNKESVEGRSSLHSTLPDVSVLRTQPKKEPSWHRALEQINALFDLTKDIGDDFRPAVSHDLVLTALESFVNRVRISVQEGSTSNEFIEDMNALLFAVEVLVCRVNEIHTSPTLSTVESVWWILQQERQNGTMKFAEPRRTIFLLRNWTAWAEQMGTPLYGRPPPIQLVMQLFRDSAAMSTDLWEFYLSLTCHNPMASWDYTRRDGIRSIPSEVPFLELSRLVLQILSKSGLEWELRQCQVIQRIVQPSSTSEPGLLDLTMALLTNEVWLALYASAKAGRVSDTAWLARFIMSTTADIGETAITEIHMALYQSMYHSKDAGSLLFMERFMWQHQHDEKKGLPFNGTTCQMLLSKYAQMANMNPYYTTASLGRRAERFMHRAYQKLYYRQWHPDAACAAHVLDAYLPNTIGSMSNASLLLSRVRKADYFVRQFVQQFHLRPYDGSNKCGINTSCRIFERLFDAYNDAVLMSFHDNDEVSRININRSAQQADELFRFYLIQYRDGRVHTEKPSESHLQQLIGLFNHCRRANVTLSFDIPQKVSEYRHLLQLQT